MGSSSMLLLAVSLARSAFSSPNESEQSEALTRLPARLRDMVSVHHLISLRARHVATETCDVSVTSRHHEAENRVFSSSLHVIAGAENHTITGTQPSLPPPTPP